MKEWLLFFMLLCMFEMCNHLERIAYKIHPKEKSNINYMDSIDKWTFNTK